MADLEPVSEPDAYATEPKSKILVLIIVSRDDRPLLIQDLSTPGWRPDPPHLSSFVAHQALDVIDDLVWTNHSMYLKEVDVFDCLAVWAFVSTSHVRFLGFQWALARQQRSVPGVQEVLGEDVPEPAHGRGELVVVPQEPPVVKEVHVEAGQRVLLVLDSDAAGHVELQEAEHHAVQQVRPDAPDVRVVEIAQLQEELDQQYQRLHVLVLFALRDLSTR
ncbi:mbp-1 interacting -2a family protein [Babesia ovata]|uniref:Mbp-1 interacting-2a family protein n=1 Tax=Babesia ovata TaxID=189622 RepID=A0A2H6K7F9_9APIC|nr:mbp-1 interacting -2a family protein [Babesia ovata]GBE58931.1 mbp-1 interacting -2a family protein [Babesia ovata]